MFLLNVVTLGEKQDDNTNTATEQFRRQRVYSISIAKCWYIVGYLRSAGENLETKGNYDTFQQYLTLN